ncbi:MAG: flagellar biosynthesis regulator FlaF [Hyphomicrobium sp.]
MYKFHYEEVAVEEGSRQKLGEREAIEYSIKLLRIAQVTGAKSSEAVAALTFVNSLWGFFLEQLASSENALPDELRAKLISIGIWIIREADAIADTRSTNFAGLIDVSQSIAEGLQ